MKIKLNINGWEFSDLYDKKFWKSLSLETYVKSYDILWDMTPVEVKNDLFFRDKDIFFTWLDSLPEIDYNKISDKIFLHKKDLVDIIINDECYLDLISEVERYSNPYSEKDLALLFNAADKFETTVMYRASDLVIAGSNIEKCKKVLLNYLYNGYYISEKILYQKGDLSSNKSIYFLKKNDYNKLIGNS